MAEPQDSTPGSGESNPTNESSRRDDGLPTAVDVIIIGTGLVESIVSAAVSRNGHTVLHIDPREYYGGMWATFSFDQWTSTSFLETPHDAATDAEVTVNDLNGSLKWKNHITSFEENWYNKDEEVKSDMVKHKRKFNIDIMPKLIAAREDIVQLLITSNVSRYLEFLRVSRLLTNLPSPKEDEIEPIPLSRADIFTSKSISLVEKRGLVKLIDAVMQSQIKKPEDDDEQQVADTESIPETFEELIKTTKASDKIKHLVKSSVTTLEDGFSPDDEVFNQQFSTRCRLFLKSIGRYGNQTPFLWTLYGISEICQAFCRLSAVYGGIFILKRHLTQINSCDDGFEVNTEEDKIKAKHIIVGTDLKCNIPRREQSRKEHASIVVGRAVLITRGGNIKDPDDSSKGKGDGIFLYRISGMEVIEMNHNSQAVPKDYRLIHVSFPVLETSVDEKYCRKMVEDKLSKFVDFEASEPPPSVPDDDGTVRGESDPIPNDQHKKPQVVYGSYFMLTFSSSSISSELFTNNGAENATSYILESTVASTDLNNYVEKARNIFNTMYPEEEFLPKAPDNDDEQENVNGGSDDVAEVPSNDNANDNGNSTHNATDENVVESETAASS